MKRFFLEYFPAWLLLAIFGFIVIHAPMTVGVGSHWPNLAVGIKAWKEIATVLALVLIAIASIAQKKLRTVFSDRLVQLIGVFAVLHGVIVMLSSQIPIEARVAGLMIDLRYFAYFTAVYLFLKCYPAYRPSFYRVGIVGAIIVVGFATLQIVLPKDFLTLLGYSDQTIAPYMTVDKNPDFIRYGSTLRGPNPLGVYALMVVAMIGAFLAMNVQRLKRHREKIMWIVAGGASLAALWNSHSRSAWIGTAIALGIIAVVHCPVLRSRRVVMGAILAGVVLVIGVYAARDTYVVQNVIIHNNPTTGASVDSNEGHLDSLKTGLARALREPLGRGVGSTGSASLMTSDPIVIENHYLFVAHEAGWLGLGLFAAIVLRVMKELWRRRGEWRALALFASGVGALFVGLLLPVWVDDTVSIVWWGFAAVVISERIKYGTTTNKKTKRIA